MAYKTSKGKVVRLSRDSSDTSPSSTPSSTPGSTNSLEKGGDVQNNTLRYVLYALAGLAIFAFIAGGVVYYYRSNRSNRSN